jgi:hypothetical protein
MLLVGRGSSWEVSSLERMLGWMDVKRLKSRQIMIALAGSLFHFSGDYFNVEASMMGGSMLCHF